MEPCKGEGTFEDAGLDASFEILLTACPQALQTMSTVDRQTLRLVSKQCRDYVHAFTSKLTGAQVMVQDTSKPHCWLLPDCPNVQEVNIKISQGNELVAYCLPSTVRSLKVAFDGEDQHMTWARHRDGVPVCPWVDLEELWLTNSSTLCQLPLLDTCTKLRALSLASCCNLVDISALQSCPNLQELNLSSCVKLDDVSALAECSSLQYLNLHGCEELADISALGSCSKLQELHLGGCYFVEDVSPLAACTKLQELHLDGCNMLDDVSPLAACSNLEYLNLSYCCILADVFVLKSCSKLERLILVDCEELEDVTDLIGASNLKYVEVTGCTKIVHSILYPENADEDLSELSTS